MSAHPAAMRPAAPRVVVTGMGLVTALGTGVEKTWQGLIAGRSGVRRIEAFDPSRLSSQMAGEVRDFDASHVLDRKELRRMDRYIQFGLVAAREAMDQAGLPARLEGEAAEETGVILASGLGGVNTLFVNVVTYAERGPDRISPFLIPMGIANVGAGQIAINYGPLGPNFATVSACASSGHSIGEAFETIRRGDARMMLAGGSESGMHGRWPIHVVAPSLASAGNVSAAMRASSAERRGSGGASRPPISTVPPTRRPSAIGVTNTLRSASTTVRLTGAGPRYCT